MDLLTSSFLYQIPVAAESKGWSQRCNIEIRMLYFVLAHCVAVIDNTYVLLQ